MYGSRKKTISRLLEWICFRWELSGVIIDQNGDFYCSPISFSSSPDILLQQLDSKSLKAHLECLIETFSYIDKPVIINAKLTLRPNQILAPIRIADKRYYLALGYLIDNETRAFLKHALPPSSVWAGVLDALPNTPCLTLAKILEDIELFMHVVDNLHFSKGARKIALHKGAPLSPLTPKEELILKLVKNGLKNPEIANELGISINTVKSHISRIFSKLHVDNRKDLTTGSIS